MKFFKILFPLSFSIAITYSCLDEPETIDYSIDLRWNKAYDNESQDEVILGLAWALAYLGADLPTGALNEGVKWKTDRIFQLDLSKMGFTAKALNAFSVILPRMRNSEEYLEKESIDLGRFITLTINTTPHYYQITGAHDRLSDFKKKFVFNGTSAAIISSKVAFEHRLIDIAESDRPEEIAFIAYEGTGSLIDKSFAIHEIEVLDLFKNGLPKFALYDNLGNLKLGASANLTLAGKPGKCLWCHDGTFPPIFDPQPEIAGYITWNEFNEIITSNRNTIAEYKATLDVDIDLNNKDGHTSMELLYLSFMEPSAERLASEWGISEQDVKDLLKDLPTHPHVEFTFLGSSLYNRHDVEEFSPYNTLPIPESPRETSETEPDFFN